jgi:guanine deaminase
MLRVMQYAVQMSKLEYARSDGRLPFLSLSEVFYMATKAGGAFFGKVGSFEKGYAFDALLVDDRSLRCGNEGSEGDLKQRLERLVYMGDDRHIEKRFCQGKLIEIKD